jgi:hypothetical protein
VGLTKRWIVVLIVAGAFLLSLPLAVPVIGFQYTFWRIHQVMDSVPKSELISRTKDLPEVKAFLAKYENSTTYIDTDFHVAVVYSITECAMTGEHCNEPGPYLAYLDVRIDLDTGYPEHTRFWCKGENHGKAPLGDEARIQDIKDCA